MILGLAITHVYYGRIKAKLQVLFAFSGCARRSQPRRRDPHGANVSPTVSRLIHSVASPPLKEKYPVEFSSRAFCSRLLSWLLIALTVRCAATDSNYPLTWPPLLSVLGHLLYLRSASRKSARSSLSKPSPRNQSANDKNQIKQGMVKLCGILSNPPTGTTSVPANAARSM